MKLIFCGIIIVHLYSNQTLPWLQEQITQQQMYISEIGQYLNT